MLMPLQSSSFTLRWRLEITPEKHFGIRMPKKVMPKQVCNHLHNHVKTAVVIQQMGAQLARRQAAGECE